MPPRADQVWAGLRLSESLLLDFVRRGHLLQEMALAIRWATRARMNVFAMYRTCTMYRHARIRCRLRREVVGRGVMFSPCPRVHPGCVDFSAGGIAVDAVGRVPG